MTAHPATTRWPLAVTLLVLIFLVFSAWSAYRAVNDGTPVLDRDYYSHGLKYNHARVEEKAAEGMGWELSARMEGHRVEVHLFDQVGRPVAACEGKLVFFTSKQYDWHDLLLVESAPGLYTATIDPLLHGEVSTELQLSRDGARISRRLLLNL